MSITLARGGDRNRLMFYQVFIAICLATVAPKDCGIQTPWTRSLHPNRSSGLPLRQAPPCTHCP